MQQAYSMSAAASLQSSVPQRAATQQKAEQQLRKLLSLCLLRSAASCWSQVTACVCMQRKTPSQTSWMWRKNWLAWSALQTSQRSCRTWTGSLMPPTPCFAVLLTATRHVLHQYGILCMSRQITVLQCHVGILVHP